MNLIRPSLIERHPQQHCRLRGIPSPTHFYFALGIDISLVFAITQQRIAIRALPSMITPAWVSRDMQQTLSNRLSRLLTVMMSFIDRQFTPHGLDLSKRGYEPTSLHPRISESTL
jgi:hypothetical protein